MNRARDLLANTSYLALAEATKPVLSFALLFVVSRTMGREGVGSYGIILTFSTLFELLATLGLGPVIVRDIAADRSRLSMYVGGGIVAAILSSLVFSPLMLITLYCFSYPETIAAGIRLLSCTLVLTVLQQFAISACEGLQNMRARAALTLTDTAGRLVLGSVFMMMGYGVLGIVNAMIIVRIATALVASRILIRSGNISITITEVMGGCFRLIRASPPFLFTVLASTAFWAVNLLVLSKSAPIDEVGLYSAASRITDVLRNIFYSCQIALLPIISASYARSAEDFRIECDLSIKYLVILTLPAATAVHALAPRIIVLLYGESFSDASHLLRLLSGTIFLFPLILVFARILIASHRQTLDTWCNISSLLANALLSWLLIPKYGGSGAALALLLSLGLFAALECAMVWRSFSHLHAFRVVVQISCASAVMALILKTGGSLSMAMLIPLAATAYAATLLALRTFTRSEIRVLFEFISNRASGKATPVPSPPSSSESTSSVIGLP